MVNRKMQKNYQYLLIFENTEISVKKDTMNRNLRNISGSIFWKTKYN